MRIADLRNKNIVIWGTGREGAAMAQAITRALPGQPLRFVDEGEGANALENFPVIREAGEIAAALDAADVLIKSPGVSLYHHLVQKFVKRGGALTSLLNLWLAEPRDFPIVGVTGTKGKSTTSSLLAHALNGIGVKAALGGNIGTPLNEVDWRGVRCGVIEVSSFQAATLTEKVDIAILTALAEEHVDWHGSLEKYYADKLNLLRHASVKIAAHSEFGILTAHGFAPEKMSFFNRPETFHVSNGRIYDGIRLIGAVQNKHLTRAHNLSNICGVLTAVKALGHDAVAALAAMDNFQPLPHRQQELGEKNGVLYVNDSIATNPHAAMAAIEFYRTRPVTLIAGGYDRGIDYAPFADYVAKHRIPTVILIGPAGQSIHETLKKRRSDGVFFAADMPEALALAEKHTKPGGVILLAPAAPSYGLFRDYADRGRAFMAASGFAPATEIEKNH